MQSLSPHGWFDGLEQETIYGWAHPGLRRNTVCAVDIIIDDNFVETVVADAFRSDLEKSGIRGGRAGFYYEIPDVYKDGDDHIVEVFHHGTDDKLGNSPQTFRINVQLQNALAFRRVYLPSKLIIHDGTQTDDFEEHLRLTRKIAIISTYHNASNFLAYHETLFRALVSNGFLTIVVHASGNTINAIKEPKMSGCYVISKRNIGYDFGSWAVAIDRLRSHLDLIDELVLLNDSIIPVDVQSIGKTLQRMRAANADVVGLTDSYEHIYHLQSYFLWLNADALRSSAFQDFMTSYSFSSIKSVVIEEGELALTRHFTNAGYAVKVLFSYDEVASLWLQNINYLRSEIEDLPAFNLTASIEDYRCTLIRRIENIAGMLLDGQPINPTHFFWDTLIDRFDFPFLKRELALVNPCSVPTYYRIGSVLQPWAEARNAVLEVRRVYGGNKLPMFVDHACYETSVSPIGPGRSTRPDYLSVIR